MKDSFTLQQKVDYHVFQFTEHISNLAIICLAAEQVCPELLWYNL